MPCIPSCVAFILVNPTKHVTEEKQEFELSSLRLGQTCCAFNLCFASPCSSSLHFPSDLSYHFLSWKTFHGHLSHSNSEDFAGLLLLLLLDFFGGLFSLLSRLLLTDFFFLSLDLLRGRFLERLVAFLLRLLRYLLRLSDFFCCPLLPSHFKRTIGHLRRSPQGVFRL